MLENQTNFLSQNGKNQVHPYVVSVVGEIRLLRVNIHYFCELMR